MSISIYHNIISKLSIELVNLIHEFVDPETTALRDKIEYWIKTLNISCDGIFQRQYFDLYTKKLVKRLWNKSEYNNLLTKESLLDIQYLSKYMKSIFKITFFCKIDISYSFVFLFKIGMEKMDMWKELKNSFDQISKGHIILALLLSGFQYEIQNNYIYKDFLDIYFNIIEKT